MLCRFVRPHLPLHLLRRWAVPHLSRRQPGTLWDHYEPEQQPSLQMHLFDYLMYELTRPRPLSEVAFYHFYHFAWHRPVRGQQGQRPNYTKCTSTDTAASIGRHIQRMTLDMQGVAADG